MRLHKHFLPPDLKQASEEFWCAKDLLEVITNEIEQGNLELAKHRCIDLTKSLHVMSKLSGNKYRIDRHNEIIKRMNEGGIHVQILRQFMQEG